jgi:hypothetical protein
LTKKLVASCPRFCQIRLVPRPKAKHARHPQVASSQLGLSAARDLGPVDIDCGVSSPHGRKKEQPG